MVTASTPKLDATTPVEDVLSIRSSNVLRRAGLERLGDVAQLTEAALSGLRNLGVRGQEEVKGVLERAGLELDTASPATVVAPSAGSPGVTLGAASEIDDRLFSVATSVALRSAGFTRLGDLTKVDRSDLRELAGLDGRQLRAILRVLDQSCLKLARVPARRRSRNDDILRMRAAGMTMAEIGERLGITESRVSQINRSLGGPDRATVQAAREEQVRAALAAALPALLRTYRDGGDVTETAAGLGLGQVAASRFVAEQATAADRAQRRLRVGRQRVYSDEAVIAAIRGAADRLGWAPTIPEYQRETASGPAASTIIGRYGSWGTALRAAGLEPPLSSAGLRRRWEVGGCRAALDRAVVAHGGVFPSLAWYREHARGRDDMPSYNTLISRLGPWSRLAEEHRAAEDAGPAAPRPAPGRHRP